MIPEASYTMASFVSSISEALRLGAVGGLGDSSWVKRAVQQSKDSWNGS